EGASLTTPTSIRGATSPAARAIARITPVIIAGLAMGNTTRHRVSALVAPNARLPSRILRGIRASPSSVATITTGRVRMARVIDAHRKTGAPKVGDGSAAG